MNDLPPPPPADGGEEFLPPARRPAEPTRREPPHRVPPSPARPPQPPPAGTRREPRVPPFAGPPPGGTRRERPSGGPRPGPAPVPTRHEPSPANQSLTNLPSALSGRYRHLGDLGSPGGESRLLRVECLEPDGLEGTLRVVKIYNQGFVIDTEALDRLKGMERAHVIGLAGWGESDGHWYEIQEYIDGGNLYALRDREGGFATARLLTVIAELAAAVHAVHRAGVLHKDIKPANVLVRADYELDLVLGDFGLSIASNLSKHFVSNSRTPQYASPEVYLNTYYEASDWWSFGMSVAELALGVHPLAELHELAIGSAIHDRPVDVEAIADERVRALCKGLLIPQYDRRWGWSQVEQWLAGADPPVPEWSAVTFRIQGFEFGGQRYFEPPALAAALGAAWRDAARLVRGGTLQTANLRDFLSQFSTHHRVAAILDDWDDQNVPADRRVAELLVALDPTLPFLPFRGVEVSMPALRELAGEVARDGSQSSHAGTLADLQQHRILEVYGALEAHRPLGAVDDAWMRTEARALQALAAAGRPAPSDEIRLAIKARALLVSVDTGAASRAQWQARRIALRYGRRCEWLRPLRKHLRQAGYAIAVVALEEEIREAARPVPATSGPAAGTPPRRGAGLGRAMATRAGAIILVVVMLAAGLYSAAVAPFLANVQDLATEGEGIGRAAADVAAYWLPSLALIGAAAVLALGQPRFAVPLVGVMGASAFVAGAGLIHGWSPPLRHLVAFPAGTRLSLLDAGGTPGGGVAAAAGIAAFVAVVLAIVATTLLGSERNVGGVRPAPRTIRRQQVALTAVALVGIVALSAQAVGQLDRPASDGDTGSGPPTNAWIAQLASLSVADGSAKRDSMLAEVRADVPEAQVLRTDDYSSLGPGYWVIFLPRAFGRGAQVIDWCDSHGRASNNTCYAAYVSRSSADKGRYCVRDPGGSLSGDC